LEKGKQTTFSSVTCCSGSKVFFQSEALHNPFSFNQNKSGNPNGVGTSHRSKTKSEILFCKIAFQERLIINLLYRKKMSARCALDDYWFQREHLNGMIPRICICCGEPMAGGNALSRNPNICSSCSSILDGMDGPEQVELQQSTAERDALPLERSRKIHNPA
jgi:hypothetical protein